MIKEGRKSGPRLLAKTLLWAVLPVSAAGARAEGVPPPETVWRGTITLVQEKSGHYAGYGDSRSPRRAEALYDEIFAVRLPFRVCGQVALAGMAQEPEFRWTSEKRTTVRSEYEKCLDEHSNPTRRVSPGDFEEHTERITGEIDPTTIPAGQFTLLIEASGSYTLIGGGAFRYLFSQRTKSERRSACSGKVSRAETVIEPGRETTAPVSDEAGVLRSTAEPLGSNIAFNGNGRIAAKGQITGETVIDERTDSGREHLLAPGDIDGGEGGYSEKATARWDLSATDPCADVRDQLRADLAFLVAYNNIELLNQGLGGKAYDDKVNQLARKLYRGGAGTPGGEGGGEPPPVTDMGVDMDCKLHGADALKEQHQALCVPEAVFDSILEHEQTHQAQCRRDKAAYRKDRETALGQSRNEIEAYCTGIRVLASWLDEDCGGPGADQQRLVDNLCR